MPRLLLLALTLAIAAPAAAQTKSGPDPKDVQAVVDKAYDFLKAHQKPDGSFEPYKAFGPKPVGYLMYGAGGSMSVTVAASPAWMA